MKIKKSQLEIGTELYQYSSQILTYKVIGKNDLVSETHTETFFILECQSCSDHEKCKIAVKFDDYGDLIYSHMLNNYDEYDSENEHYKNRQHYWHKNDRYNWFRTRKEAREFIYNKNISYYKGLIEENNNKIVTYNEKIKEEQDRINSLNEL